MTETTNPDVVFQQILDTKPRPQKVKSLQAIHELCRNLYESKSRDFSLNTIRKEVEKQGIMNGKGLYNDAAADHRKLIEAWERLAGPVPVRAPVKVLATDAMVELIDDPAVRMLMQAVIAERNKLKAQLNTLKSNTTIVINRQPAAVAGKQREYIALPATCLNAGRWQEEVATQPILSVVPAGYGGANR